MKVKLAIDKTSFLRPIVYQPKAVVTRGELLAQATSASNRLQKWSDEASYSCEFQPASNAAAWQLLSNHSRQHSPHLNQCCFVNLYDLNQWFSTYLKSQTP